MESKISKIAGMGTNILVHPELLPKNKSNNIWIENLTIFHKCGGKVTEYPQKESYITAPELNSVQLTQLARNCKPFATKGIDKLSQIVKE